MTWNVLAELSTHPHKANNLDIGKESLPDELHISPQRITNYIIPPSEQRKLLPQLYRP